jgi:3-(methylthio)propionyl---CoA ligase
MTEISPVGLLNRPKRELGEDAAPQRRTKQGRAFFGIDLKIIDEAGQELPWDGRTPGHLLVRGLWVCRAYYRGEDDGAAHDAAGWLRTGDVATIDPDGYVEITNRGKDLIKSGGEWISSITLENIAVGHPEIAEAAAIAARHPVWDERPLLLVVPKEGRSPDPADLLRTFEGKVAKWWVPDAVVIVSELPHTATGKLMKTALRERYGEYYIERTA